MKELAQAYQKAFMLTGERGDPTDIDFTFYAHEKVTNNEDGTPALKEYYMNYNSGSDSFSDLAVQCTYTYTYDSGGAITRRVEDIDWFFIDGSVGESHQLVQVIE